MKILKSLFCLMLLAALALTSFAGTARAQDKEPDAKTKAELEKLQGSWHIVSGMDDGADLPADVANGMKLEFKGQEVTQVSNGQEHHAKFTLDTSVTPPRLSVTPLDGDESGHTLVVLYKLEGDTMTLCASHDGKAPKGFDGAKGSGNTLLVLKRTPPAPATDSEAAKTDQAFFEAVVKQDSAAVERLLAPGFAGVGPGGVLVDRATFLKNLMAMQKLTKAERVSVSVREFGNAAVITGIVKLGDSAESEQNITRLYIKRKDGWQIVAVQATKQGAQPGDAKAAPGDTPKAKEAASNADEEPVRAALKAENAAMLKQDGDTLGRLYSDNLVVIVPSGDQMSRAAWLELIAKSIKLDQLDVSEETVTMYGDVAVSFSKVAYHVAGTSDYPAVRVLQILAKQQGDWHIVTYQTTYSE